MNLKEGMMSAQLYIHYKKEKRKARIAKCTKCGKEWLIREERSSCNKCMSCRSKGEFNGMYGRIPWNKGDKLFTKEKQRNAVRNSNNKTRWKRKKEIVKAKGNKCFFCEAKNLPIVCYELHHINPNEKEYSISQLLFNKKKLNEEIGKCALVCANCHRIFHHGDERLEG